MTWDNVTPPPRPLECQFIAGYPSPLPTSDPPIFRRSWQLAGTHIYSWGREGRCTDKGNCPTQARNKIIPNRVRRQPQYLLRVKSDQFRGEVSKETVVLRRWESVISYNVRGRVSKLTLRALALRQSEWGNQIEFVLTCFEISLVFSCHS